MDATFPSHLILDFVILIIREVNTDYELLIL